MSAVQREGGPAEVLFAETMFYGAWFYVLMVLLYGFLIYMAIIAFTKGALLLPISLLLLLLMLAATYSFFSRLVFIITTNTVEFGFAGPFRRRFPSSALVSCEPAEISLKNYLGFGPRPGLDGTMGYVARNGAGVRMEFEDAPRPFVVSVSDPDRVCRLLTGGRS